MSNDREVIRTFFAGMVYRNKEVQELIIDNTGKMIFVELVLTVFFFFFNYFLAVESKTEFSFTL